jgi:hypothetical protein
MAFESIPSLISFTATMLFTGSVYRAVYTEPMPHPDLFDPPRLQSPYSHFARGSPTEAPRTRITQRRVAQTDARNDRRDLQLDSGTDKRPITT